MRVHFSFHVAAVMLLTVPALASAMDTYNQARAAMPLIYKHLDGGSTLYCGCAVHVGDRDRLRTDIKACGYVPRKDEQRARRVELEHVMPAYDFGRALQCWQQGGRKNCRAVSPAFNAMEGDLHNLWPVIGEVNGDRSNYRYDAADPKPGQYGSCPVQVDFKGRRVMISHQARGIVARSYLYMADRYAIRMGDGYRRMLQAWDKQYPPTSFECARHEAIAALQGVENAYVRRQCGSLTALPE